MNNAEKLDQCKYIYIFNEKKRRIKVRRCGCTRFPQSASTNCWAVWFCDVWKINVASQTHRIPLLAPCVCAAAATAVTRGVNFRKYSANTIKPTRQTSSSTTSVQPVDGIRSIQTESNACRQRTARRSFMLAHHTHTQQTVLWDFQFFFVRL